MLGKFRVITARLDLDVGWQWFSKREFNNLSDIEVRDFLQPHDLVKMIDSTGCFVLPSRFEPWGVVVHELLQPVYH